MYFYVAQGVTKEVPGEESFSDNDSSLTTGTIRLLEK